MLHIPDHQPLDRTRFYSSKSTCLLYEIKQLRGLLFNIVPLALGSSNTAFAILDDASVTRTQHFLFMTTIAKQGGDFGLQVHLVPGSGRSQALLLIRVPYLGFCRLSPIYIFAKIHTCTTLLQHPLVAGSVTGSANM